MKKSIISLLLAISMLAGIMVLPSFAAPSSSSDEEAQKILFDLGIIDSTDGANQSITRGEFADEITKVMNVVSLPEGYVLPFSDVAPGSKYHNGVYNLFAWKAISPSDKFRPDDVITSNEALKIAVSLLGYDFLAVNNGGYPGGYVAAASQLKITPNALPANLTKADAWEIMFNMLHTELPLVTISANGENNYKIKGAGTLLKERWNIEIYDGMVTDGQNYGINYEKGVGDGKVAIDGYEFKSGGFNTDALFGDEVSAYYDANTYTLRAIYSKPSTDKKNIKLFSSQEIEFDRDTYTYYDEKDKEKKAKLSYDATIIYNGQTVMYDEDIMVPENGYVKLLSVNSSDIDVVIIRSYTEAVVGTTNETDLLVSDKMNEGTSYIFDGDYITYANQDGAVCQFKDIKENDILWISINKDGEINEVIICSDVIAGELTGTSENSIYVDDRAYEVSDFALRDIQKNYQFGSIVRGCINPDGKIVYFVAQKASDSTTVGYIMYSGLMSRGLSSSAFVKMLGTDGLVKEFTISDTLMVNGKTFKGSAADIYANLPKQTGNEKSIVSSLVVYKADRSDRLVSIAYPDDVARTYGFEPYGFYKNGEVIDHVFHKTSQESSMYIQYKSSDRALYSQANERIFPSSTMVRFQVPDPQKASDYEDKDYKVTGFPSSNTITAMDHFGYSTIEGQIQSDYVVGVYYDAGGASDEHVPSSNLMLVSEVSQIVNDEGMEVERIQVVRTNGTTTEYYSEELGYFEKLGIKFGDIVKINANAKGVVTGITVFYQGKDSTGKDRLCANTTFNTTYPVQEDNAIVTNKTGMGTLVASLIILGTVYDSDGLVIKLLPANYDIETNEDESKYRPFSMYGKNIVFCDLKTETVSTLTAGEIKSYLDFGTNCHKAVIQTYSGTVNSVFLYAY